jgi:hypothetical protein
VDLRSVQIAAVAQVLDLRAQLIEVVCVSHGDLVGDPAADHTGASAGTRAGAASSPASGLEQRGQAPTVDALAEL